MWKPARNVVIVLLSLSMTSCGWLGCRWLGCRRRPDYDRPLPPGEMALRKLTDPKDYPDFGSGFKRRTGLVEAIDHSLAYYAKPSSQKHFPYLDIPHERAVRTLKSFKEVLRLARDPVELHRMICERFDVYISVGCDDRGTVLFTGYCTPIFEASLTRTSEFRYPLYTQPPDLVKREEDGMPLGRRTPSGEIVPYYTRADIENKQLLAGQGLELCWLADPLEAYIVHVQGSANLRLPDGSSLPVGYIAKTDRPYTSLGRALVADKRIRSEDLSLQTIIRYFKDHPRELRHYMHLNESYVFFTKRDGPAVGALNAPVTPYRTIATDNTVFPWGLLAFVVTQVPERKTRDEVTLEPFHSFVLDQDTGSAIRAAGRADIYMGVGDDALLLAGRTKSEGKLYYLAAK